MGLWWVPSPICLGNDLTEHIGHTSAWCPSPPRCPHLHNPFLQHRCNVLSQDIWILSISCKQTSSFFGTFCSQFISEPELQSHPQTLPLKCALQRMEKAACCSCECNGSLPQSHVPPSHILMHTVRQSAQLFSLIRNNL